MIEARTQALQDGLQPEPDRLVGDLQLSINRTLMNRIDALTARVDALEKRIKGVAAAGPVY